MDGNSKMEIEKTQKRNTWLLIMELQKLSRTFLATFMILKVHHTCMYYKSDYFVCTKVSLLFCNFFFFFDNFISSINCVVYFLEYKILLLLQF